MGSNHYQNASHGASSAYYSRRAHTATGHGVRKPQAKAKAKSVDANAIATGEKRLRRYRDKEPLSFGPILERATTQRFYVLSQTACGTDDCPELFLQVSGSTGNVYDVCIAQQPSCSCPHALAGNQCKHIVFVLKKVLRASHHHVYQLALLSTELVEIMGKASQRAHAASWDQRTGEDGRKAVEGDCPICFDEMGVGRGSEPLVWCQGACGQNIHRRCMEVWAATKRQAGRAAEVPCPYCRAPWTEAGAGADRTSRSVDIGRAKFTRDGYQNVADQVDVSTRRDYSTYSRWWSGHPDYYGRRRYR
ncbi:hypothetical protein BD289DRAFT_461683 [Coniella lustricola]|uniref:Uncharacterized protein n=1 Tax=Coniella lustricola TaxID=2025994 RepID=A0A2T3A461_9PEZI|nr:hypothetical protein BD289DRAFT_461683 [Coniella lustricola]